jgi:hypothetical protein
MVAEGRGLIRRVVRQQLTKVVNAVSQRDDESSTESIRRRRLTKEKVVAQFTLPFTSMATGHRSSAYNLCTILAYIYIYIYIYIYMKVT